MAIGKNKIANPNNILAIKFSSIGDIVLTTSPIQSLKNAYPESNISILTLHEFAPLLEGVTFINNIIPFDRTTGFLSLVRTGKWINSSDYDLIVDFHNTLRSKIILSFVKKIQKRILRKPRWKRFMLFRFRKNRFGKDFKQIKLLHSPLEESFQTKPSPLPKLYVSNTEVNSVKTILTNNGLMNEYITIVPGAAWDQKVWSGKQYNELIQRIKADTNYDFVILGSENDKICAEISNLNKNVINLAGKTSIRESLAIIANSNITIGADTGFVHAAEALGKDVAMIIGPTSIETGAGVNRKTSINIENTELWCRPCSQNGSRKCYRSEQFCMTTISSDLAYSKIKGLLN